MALMLPSCAGRTLTQKDYLAGGIYTAARIGDVITTEKGMERGYKELNPFLGEHPSDGDIALWGLAGIGLGWAILKYVPDAEAARTAVYVMSLLSGMVIIHNWGEL